MSPTYSCAIRSSTPSERPSHEPPSRKSQRRAVLGVINARRPGPRPGRSEAKSIDDAEHGASIEDAMVAGAKPDSPNATLFGKDGHASGPDLRVDLRLLCPGEPEHDHVHAGGAFVRHVLSTHDSDKGHDQRWRERPGRGALGPPAGQDTGVVHASVGSATATPASLATAAQSAASRTRSPQVAAIEALERSSRSWSHQG